MAYEWPINHGAVREDFQQFVRVDPTVRSISLDGRPRNRRAPRPILYGFIFTLRMLSAEEKEALEAFQEEVRVGGESFTWEDDRPSENTGGTVGLRNVRLASPLIFELDGEGSNYLVEVHLDEV